MGLLGWVGLDGPKVDRQTHVARSRRLGGQRLILALVLVGRRIQIVRRRSSGGSFALPRQGICIDGRACQLAVWYLAARGVRIPRRTAAGHVRLELCRVVL
jgi:hypothetical protein